MKELFEEVKKGDMEIFEDLERIIERQFDIISKSNFFEKNKKLEKGLLNNYKMLRESISNYKN